MQNHSQVIHQWHRQLGISSSGYTPRESLETCGTEEGKLFTTGSGKPEDSSERTAGKLVHTPMWGWGEWEARVDSLLFFKLSALVVCRVQRIDSEFGHSL